MRKTLFRLSMIAFALLGMQSTLTAQEKTPLNQVVNTLKERISLAGYAQIIATALHPAAPPPNASTPPVTANPITMFVTTANIKRMEPSCTLSCGLLVISADSVEYATPFAV